jgi:hypothetical protein
MWLSINLCSLLHAEILWILFSSWYTQCLWFALCIALRTDTFVKTLWTVLHIKVVWVLSFVFQARRPNWCVLLWNILYADRPTDWALLSVSQRMKKDPVDIYVNYAARSVWITPSILLHEKCFFIPCYNHTPTYVVSIIQTIRLQCKRKCLFLYLSFVCHLMFSKFFIFIFLSVWPLLPTQCMYKGLLLHLITLNDTHTRTRTHTHTLFLFLSGGLLRTRDRPVADTFTRQHKHSQETDIQAPGGILTRSPSKQAASDLGSRPRGHWDRLNFFYKYENIFFLGAKTYCLEQPSPL